MAILLKKILLISRQISTIYALMKIMYADDIVIVTEQRDDLQDAIGEWNELFKKHGLNMNIDRAILTSVGKQRLDGKYIKQVNNCVYLGGNISESGRVAM